jgi:hypothetical protein
MKFLLRFFERQLSSLSTIVLIKIYKNIFKVITINFLPSRYSTDILKLDQSGCSCGAM